MHPEFVEFLGAFPPLQFVDPVAMRAEFERLRADVPAPPWPDGVVREDRFVPGADGLKVPVRVYLPADAGADAPIVLWIHGGGYCVGTLDDDESACARLAARLGSVVVSVDYRLAPEHPYPAGLDDCFSTLKHVAAEAGSSYPSGPLAVAGASAGAGLAAAVALRARDEGGPVMCAQMLLYPFLDATMSGESLRTLHDSPVFNAEDARVCWNHYLGEALATPPVYSSPSVSADLSGLPPAYVLAAGQDCLRDEAIEYALRLQAAGVPTELHVVPGVPHAFAGLLPPASASKRANSELCAVLGGYFGVGERQTL